MHVKRFEVEGDLELACQIVRDMLKRDDVSKVYLTMEKTDE
jgi:hypothetical protein